MSEDHLLGAVAAQLTVAGIDHMVVGSFASTFHGSPRTTAAVDLVIDPDPTSLDRFLAGIDRARCYVPDDSARAALRLRDQFNVVDLTSRWKVDLIVRKDRPFSRAEFERREPARIAGADVFVASREDTVLAKLEWAAQGGSDRQLEDVRDLLRVAGPDLDVRHLDRWATELGVADLLARCRREVGA